MVCKKCNVDITISNLGKGKLCKNCTNKYYRKYRKLNKKKYNEYLKEYMATKRWLNGGPDNFLLGEKKPVHLRSVGGVLHIPTEGNKLLIKRG